MLPSVRSQMKANPITGHANSKHKTFDSLPPDTNMVTISPSQTPDAWRGSRDSELDMILDAPSIITPSASNGSNYLDFNMQMLGEEPFLMGDEYFQDPPTFESFNPNKPATFDPALWANPMSPAFCPTTTENDCNRSQNNQMNLDYFALGQEMEENAAPTDFGNHPVKVKAETSASPPHQPQLPTEAPTSTNPSPKIPKKRGRKRKQLDADAQVVERKKFLERNRVAANRCRERKKTYVSNLENRGKDMQTRNSFLREEMDRLNEEIVSLRMLVSVECGCDEAMLAANLRERLLDGGEIGEDVVEDVVQKFISLRRSGGVPRVQAWQGMQISGQTFQSGGGSGSRSTRSTSSVFDEVFSPLSENAEDGGESSENSPVEMSEADKLNYMVL